MTALVIYTVIVTVLGVANAWLTVQVRAGWPWWTVPIGGLASYAVWALAARGTTTNLVVLSAWFDVVVALAWFAGFRLFGGESINATQWVGVALLCAGLGLINLK